MSCGSGPLRGRGRAAAQTLTPVVGLNWAVAVAEVDWSEAGLAALGGVDELEGYHAPKPDEPTWG